jgi:hypothetical protein
MSAAEAVRAAPAETDAGIATGRGAATEIATETARGIAKGTEIAATGIATASVLGSRSAIGTETETETETETASAEIATRTEAGNGIATETETGTATVIVTGEPAVIAVCLRAESGGPEAAAAEEVAVDRRGMYHH